MKAKIAGAVKPQLSLLNSIGIKLSHIKTEEDLIIFAERANAVRSQIMRAFPDLSNVFSRPIRTVGNVEHALTKFCAHAHKLKIDISVTKIKQIFRQIWNYVSKMLMGMNLGIAIMAFPLQTLSIALICTLLVVLNAHKHGITWKQAYTNFTQSFKDFLKRDGLTTKEKKASYIPIFLLKFLLYINKYTGGIFTHLGAYATAVITWLGSNVPFWSDSINAGANAVGSFIAGTGGTIAMQLFTVFIIATLVYLIMDVVDDWILRRGEGAPV